ncbi:transposase [Candidatus Bipolaricaulota bacterium]
MSSSGTLLVGTRTGIPSWNHRQSWYVPPRELTDLHSGDHGARITKRGNREVRQRLFEATLSAARCNPSIRAIYRRLRRAASRRRWHASLPRESCYSSPMPSAIQATRSENQTQERVDIRYSI